MQEDRDSAWEDLQELCPGLQKVEFDKHVGNLQAAAVPLECHADSLPTDFSPSNAPGRNIAFLPSTMRFFGWLAGRLGVDLRAHAAVAAEPEGVHVRTVVMGGSASTPQTYERYPTDFAPASLVIIDPPFGLGSGPAWDREDLRWTAGNVTSALTILKSASRLSDTRLVVAVYAREEDLQCFQKALEDWDADNHKRSLRLYMARDGTHQMVPGTLGGGARVAVLVVQYYDAGVKCEDTGLGARFLYSFRPPQRRSKHGRHEIDARLLHADGSPVNKHQKPVEEYRLLVRMLALKGTTVISLCNGTGTGNIAATLEGFDSVGVEVDAEQNAVARRRLRVLFHREAVLLKAMAADPQAVAELDAVAMEEGLVEPVQVGNVPHNTQLVPARIPTFTCMHLTPDSGRRQCQRGRKGTSTRARLRS